MTTRWRDQSYLSALVTPIIVLPALLGTIFQLAFTTLFGIFVTFVFLRTGNVWSCILIHTFCNWMGVPQVWGRLAPVPFEYPGGNGRWSPGLGFWWTPPYYLLLVGGAYAFSQLLYPLTESSYRLTSTI